VVDNASVDGSYEKLQGYPDIRLIRNPSNYGFAKANNIGIKRARGKYLILLNSDTIVTYGWLERLEECAEADFKIGLATPKLLRPDGKLDSTGHIYWFREADGTNRGEDQLDRGQYDNSTELLTCDFACVLIKREVLGDIGVLDEKILFYHEDIDFCLRARIAGWRVVYCPSSIVYHHRGASSSPDIKKRLAEQRKRYLLRLVLKNYEAKNIFLVLLSLQRQVLLAILGVLAGLKNRDFAYCRQRLRTIELVFITLLWNLLHPPLKERIIAQARRRVPDHELLKLSGSP
jgi:GT2 family glycosyltransferase